MGNSDLLRLWRQFCLPVIPATHSSPRHVSPDVTEHVSRVVTSLTLCTIQAGDNKHGVNIAQNCTRFAQNLSKRNIKCDQNLNFVYFSSVYHLLLVSSLSPCSPDWAHVTHLHSAGCSRYGGRSALTGQQNTGEPGRHNSGIPS